MRVSYATLGHNLKVASIATWLRMTKGDTAKSGEWASHVRHERNTPYVTR